jgi:hypothetical protein
LRAEDDDSQKIGTFSLNSRAIEATELTENLQRDLISIDEAIRSLRTKRDIPKNEAAASRRRLLMCRMVFGYFFRASA